MWLVLCIIGGVYEQNSIANVRVDTGQPNLLENISFKFLNRLKQFATNLCNRQMIIKIHLISILLFQVQVPGNFLEVSAAESIPISEEI